MNHQLSSRESFINDLSQLSSVDTSVITKFYELFEDIISQQLWESITSDSSKLVHKIPLPFMGSLRIDVSEIDNPKLSIDPDKKFLDKLSKSSSGSSSLYDRKLSELISKILSQYDEV